MLKILIPVDASNESRYAVRHVIRRVWTGESLDIHLIHVQPRLGGYLSRFAPHGARGALCAESSANVFKAAGELLDRAGLRYSAVHVSQGDPAREIVCYAESNRFDSILMATSRLGLMSGMILGSVTAEVLRTSRIPVEVVPASPRVRRRSCAGPTCAMAWVVGPIYLALE